LKHYILALLLSLSTLVVADVAQFSWTTPTKKVDGTELLAIDINSYTIRTTVGETYRDLTIQADSDNTATTVMEPGSYLISIATTTDVGTGPFSEQLSIVVEEIAEEALPEAPTEVEVNIKCDLSGCTMQIK
jgi:hypothetical protein